MRLISEPPASATSTVRIVRYEPSLRALWDRFVAESKNGTFLFFRNYMDYHADRFRDYSLLVYFDDELSALLPANQVGQTVWSHQGLTFGGFITGARMSTPRFMACFDGVLGYLRLAGVADLVYKTIPHIYHRFPAEEDRYALFCSGASLYRRDVLSVIELAHPLPVQTRRQRGARRACDAGLEVRESAAWEPAWEIITERLLERYGVPPVHDVGEIKLLNERFPEHIRLFVAQTDAQIYAAVVMYVSEQVAHVQYMAATDQGRALGALDLIHLELLERVFAERRFYDFGISNEDEGRYLNVGLIEQKEGFGGRAVVHDFYRLRLEGVSRE